MRERHSNLASERVTRHARAHNKGKALGLGQKCLTKQTCCQHRKAQALILLWPRFTCPHTPSVRPTVSGTYLCVCVCVCVCIHE